MPSLSMLVGFMLVDADTGKEVGRIASIDDSTHNILFELEDGRLIPASDYLIHHIDTTERTIKTIIPEGLLEI